MTLCVILRKSRPFRDGFLMLVIAMWLFVIPAKAGIFDHTPLAKIWTPSESDARRLGNGNASIPAALAFRASRQSARR